MGNHSFMDRAETAVSSVLKTHQIVDSSFIREDGDKTPWRHLTFFWEGEDHRIEIYRDEVVMHQGDRLFEPYMPREFESNEAQIRGFCERLDRYLSGGDWEGPDEVGPLGRFLKRFLTMVGLR